jgi:serine/threonine-protein kinase RsbT
VSEDETLIPIQHEGDIVTARQKGRELALKAGFKGSDLTLIATAISEVARNIIVYAKFGEIILNTISSEGGRRGIAVQAKDQGPGIPDIDRAMQDGFSTGNSLGLGLPGARRLMDEFTLASMVGKGTTVTMRKWAP